MLYGTPHFQWLNTARGKSPKAQTKDMLLLEWACQAVGRSPSQGIRSPWLLPSGRGSTVSPGLWSPLHFRGRGKAMGMGLKVTLVTHTSNHGGAPVTWPCLAGTEGGKVSPFLDGHFPAVAPYFEEVGRNFGRQLFAFTIRTFFYVDQDNTVFFFF